MITVISTIGWNDCNSYTLQFKLTNGASYDTDSITIYIDENQIATFDQMPEARISINPSATKTYVLPSSNDDDGDSMTVSVSSSIILPSYITFNTLDRTFTISSPNTANLNDIVTLQYVLSDGFNTTSHTTEVLFSLIPTPTIISSITDISVKVGETITVPVTLSSDFVPGDTINVWIYEFDWTDYQMKLVTVPTFI